MEKQESSMVKEEEEGKELKKTSLKMQRMSALLCCGKVVTVFSVSSRDNFEQMIYDFKRSLLLLWGEGTVEKAEC